MAKRSITVELSDETLQGLSALGEPSAVLARLAISAAEGVTHPIHSQREQTDESLRVERDKADLGLAGTLNADEAKADDVLRIARLRADEVVRSASDDAASGRARAVLEDERSNADAVLESERALRKRNGAELLASEREATDKDLSGERSHADTVLIDQREANTQLVRATIRAQELTEEAAADRERAEQSARDLLAFSEFRELFIGVLGHDLRNPVSSVVMASALLLRRGKLDEQDAELVARIIRSSQRITKMITQVLDLTRARLGGGLPVVPKPIDLQVVCRNAVEEFEATIELEVIGDVTGSWDEDRLAQVLSNLIGNAVEHAARGTVVRVSARADGADVVVEIRNEGTTIPTETLVFIFEPFRRAKEQERSPAGNLGLGLYIAKQIVLAHGGTLEVQSSDGATTFQMRLPRSPPRLP